MGGRLTSSHFVGRQGALAELELAFRDAGVGRPGLLLLGGDSGVGKTRLVAEFKSRLPEALMLSGDCVEQGDGELPYAPLLGMLRPLVRHRHPVWDALSPGSRSQLATLLPSLGEPAASARRGSEAVGQMRLFEALLELLDLLSERQPLVLTFEDMHWADRSTRAFTAFLARSLRHERVLLLITYRSDELHRRHPLRSLLTELDRLEWSRRVDLAPFDRAELAEALKDILGEVAADPLVDRLFARSEGNPLYTEELLAAGLDGRGAAPQSLSDAFLLRTERLSEDARLVLRAVAVGVRLDEATIAAVSGIEHDRLHTALRETVAEQILVTGEDGRFQFRHALLREALYDDLLPGERGELHLALARCLEQLCGADDDSEVERVAAMASHYAAAGEQSAALRATIAAALAADHIHAYGEVAEAAERALELWPRVPEMARESPIDHVELLALAARAHRLAGERPRAQSLLQRALAELSPEEDSIRYARLLARLARIHWSMNRGAEALETGQRALELLPPGVADRDRSALLSWLARTRALRGRYREAITAGEAALSAAITAGDPGVEGEVLNTLGMARIALGDVSAGEAQLRRAVEIGREQGDPEDVATAYANLSDFLNLAGRTTDALQTAREGLSQTSRRVTRSHDWMALTVATLAFEAGEWSSTRSHLPRVGPSMVGVMLIFRTLVEAELALGEGADDRAGDLLDSVEPLVRVTSEAQWHGAFGSLLGELLRRRGDLDGARTAVARALDELEVCTDDVMRIARVTAVGIGIEADRALRARDLRETAQSREALARARIHVQRLKAAAQTGGPVERAWLEIGNAELARGRGRNAPARWRSAADAFASLARPYPEAVARWRAAEAMVESSDRDGAAEMARSALETARNLDARWLAGEVEALVARGRLEFVARDGAPDPAPRPEDPFGLTSRERQVLALVAAGATNRQIGAKLFMAEKTASVHVSRILGKLGVRSRTQAAAVAHRLHLS